MCIFFDKCKKENGEWAYPSIMVTLNNGDVVTFNYVQYVFLQGDYLEFNTFDNNRKKTTNSLHNVEFFSVQSY